MGSRTYSQSQSTIALRSSETRRRTSPGKNLKLNAAIDSFIARWIPGQVENGLREHDDDPRPSSIIATLVKKPYFDAGSRARHLSVFLSFLILLQTSEKRISSHFV
jgi:hypothetical protein